MRHLESSRAWRILAIAAGITWCILLAIRPGLAALVVSSFLASEPSIALWRLVGLSLPAASLVAVFFGGANAALAVALMYREWNSPPRWLLKMRRRADGNADLPMIAASAAIMVFLSIWIGIPAARFLGVRRKAALLLALAASTARNLLAGYLLGFLSAKTQIRASVVLFAVIILFWARDARKQDDKES